MRFHTIRLELVDSTNERALQAIADGEARHGDVFVARAQTRGRGRRGATWHSAPGEGAYFSIVLLPERAIHPAALTMAAGLGVHGALASLVRSERKLALEPKLTLDWPNDVALGHAKLAGILVETRGLDPRHPHYVVGIGINVAQREFPRELLDERAVTSLALAGFETTVERVVEACLQTLADELEQASRDPESVAEDYARRARLIDRRVRIDAGASEKLGVLREVSITRGLALEVDSGAIEYVPIEHVRSLAAS